MTLLDSSREYHFPMAVMFEIRGNGVKDVICFVQTPFSSANIWFVHVCHVRLSIPQAIQSERESRAWCLGLLFILPSYQNEYPPSFFRAY